MKFPVRSVTAVAAFALFGAYVMLALRGPQGVPALMEKRQEIRKLDEDNQNLRAIIDKRKERIRVLSTSSETQELEIRKRLKLQRKGDTTLFLPEQPAH
ncbi:MAG: septum formation initiator family protein [Bryobacteraceae bacterium]